MFPEGFVQRIWTQDYLDAQKLLEALERPSPVSIRINRLKWNREPAHSFPVPWCRDGFYIGNRPSFTADPLFHAGCYYPQDASGMFTEVIFNQLFPGKKRLMILDLCGAPGSKSTHLASLLGDNGTLIANETIRSRSAVLAENLTKWGIPNFIVTNSDPSALGRLIGWFDLVVADVPCSGEGMFRNLDVRKEWSEENAALCASRQRRIMFDIWPALKENGILIYSTCTFNPAENEKNIQWLIENTDAEILKTDISRFPDIKEIFYKRITGYGFFPDRTTGDGFFIAFARKKSKTPKFLTGPSKTSSPVSRDVLKQAERMTEISGDEILRSGDTVYRIPVRAEEYSTLSTVAKIIKPGTAIFREAKGDIIPQHDLALSLLLKDRIFPQAELNYHEAVSYLRRESIMPACDEKGWCLVKYNGINLGFIKNLDNRTNNYYPVEWRIRMKVTPDNEKKLIEWKKESAE